MKSYPVALVVGCEGQIGRTLCQYLGSQNFNYVGLNKQALDISNYSQVQEVLSQIEFDVLVNCAAFTNTENAEQFPEQAFKVNREGPAYLAKVCKQNDKALIHISTNCVFDGVKAEPYIETDIPNPQSVYGKSKYSGEQAVAEEAGNHVILRTSWAFSQYPGHNFVLKILKIASDQGFLKVVNDQFGRPTSAANIAYAIIQIIPKLVAKEVAPGVYHYGSDRPASWFDFTQKIFEMAVALGLSVPIEVEPVQTGIVPTKVDRPKNGILDCAKIQKDLAITLPKWEDDLQNVLNLVYAQRT